MSQNQTLQDIYYKIADIEDVLCNLDNDPITAITNSITVLENGWNVPPIILENPNNEQQIIDAQKELNELLQLAFYAIQNNEIAYEMSLGNTDITPVPKGTPIMWLPILINVLVMYRVPLKVLSILIADFIKEILLEHIKKRINQKPNVLFGNIELTSTRRFNIPNKAEKLVIYCLNIPDWFGKRYDRVYGGQNDNFNRGLGTISLGFKGKDSTEIWWNNDRKIEYSKQSIDLYELKNMNDRYGYIYLENQITCQIRFL
jgi:hypothetical protein